MCSIRRAWLVIGCLLVLTGCDMNKQKGPTTRPAGTMSPDELRRQSSVAMNGTIGSVSYLQGTRLMRVHGYGLVINLNGKGSRNVRSAVRNEVLKELRRYRSANPHATRDLPTPEQQLDSLDSAVVEVIADVPAGALVDQHFDVTVRADDADTQSLVGGFLVPCDLKIYQETAPGEGREGRIHARAGGRIFINPFAITRTDRPTSQPSTVSLREGIIIGGGVNKLDRRVSLVTIVDSYATVRAIQDAVNSHFGGHGKYADATSPTNVDLKIPPEYANDRPRFLELLMHLPLVSSPIQREARTKALLAELGRPDAPLDDTALALEGVGHSVIAAIQPFYTDPRRPVNYYAARTGMRLSDELAIEVVIRHAGESKSPYRLPAIRELGYCKNPAKASGVLHSLLGSSDARVRIKAYEALRRVDPEVVAQFMVGEQPENFLLEVVQSDGPAMVYARRTETRRIALIGGDRMTFRPPLLYAQEGQPVTLSANDAARFVTIMRKDIGGRSVGPLELPLAVVPLIRFMGGDLRLGIESRLEGLGLDYSTVLDILYRLCEKGAINADMRWEEPSVEDILGPLEPLGRPESEL